MNAEPPAPLPAAASAAPLVDVPVVRRHLVMGFV